MIRTRFQYGLSSSITLSVIALAARAATTAPGGSLFDGSGRAPEIAVRTVEPEGNRGTLVSFDLEAGLRLSSDGAERRVAAEDVVSITVPSIESQVNARDAVLTLTDGGFLYGQLLESADESISFEARDIGRVSIPMEQVSAFEVSRSAGSEHRETIAWFRGQPASAEDRILMSNGDVVAGFVTRLEPDGVVLDVKGSETKAPARLLLAVRLAVAGKSERGEERFATIDLRGGGRLRATSLDWTARVARIRTSFAPALSIESDRIVAVHLSGGRWEWLSDHQPISADHTPAFGANWDMVRDGNVMGRSISVGGDGFERGLGVHSRSRVVYDLRGEYRQFVTSFGLDDEAGAHADVAVTILIDGQPRYREASVRSGKLHGPVSLDVAGAKRIELVVDFGANGDIQDRFNWVEPALVR